MYTLFPPLFFPDSSSPFYFLQTALPIIMKDLMLQKQQLLRAFLAQSGAVRTHPYFTEPIMDSGYNPTNDVAVRMMMLRKGFDLVSLIDSL